MLVAQQWGATATLPPLRQVQGMGSAASKVVEGSTESLRVDDVTPLVDGYHRGGEQAMARALPCVSPHSGAREELPQAYVVSDLSASHSALPWFRWALPWF